MILNNIIPGPIGMMLASREPTRAIHVSSMLYDQLEPWDNLTPSKFESSPLNEPPSNLGNQLNGISSTLEYHRMGNDSAPMS